MHTMQNVTVTVFRCQSDVRTTLADTEGTCCFASPRDSCSSCERSGYTLPRSPRTRPACSRPGIVNTRLQKNVHMQGVSEYQKKTTNFMTQLPIIFSRKFDCTVHAHELDMLRNIIIFM